MQRIINIFYKFLEILLVCLLSGMAIMVFLNVVLRYGFNSGFVLSEELARFFFIWLTFIGAVVTFRDNSHLGIESFVQLLSRRGRLCCMAVVNSLIMFCSAVFFIGTWKQFDINASMYAPVTGMSLIWVYGVGLFTGSCVFVIAGERLLRILIGRITDHEISVFAGEGIDIEKLAER
jgi:TRAP-type transport system small permease protein